MRWGQDIGQVPCNHTVSDSTDVTGLVPASRCFLLWLILTKISKHLSQALGLPPQGDRKSGKLLLFITRNPNGWEKQTVASNLFTPQTWLWIWHKQNPQPLLPPTDKAPNYPEWVHTSPAPPQISLWMSPNRGVRPWQHSYQGQTHRLGLLTHQLLRTQPSTQPWGQEAPTARSWTTGDMELTGASQFTKPAHHSWASFLTAQYPWSNPCITGGYQLSWQKQGTWVRDYITSVRCHREVVGIRASSKLQEERKSCPACSWGRLDPSHRAQRPPSLTQISMPTIILGDSEGEKNLWFGYLPAWICIHTLPETQQLLLLIQDLLRLTMNLKSCIRQSYASMTKSA